MQLTEKGAIGDTSSDADTTNDPDASNDPDISNDPSNPVPTPEDNNHRGMSNSHSHKDSGNKLMEALHLPAER